MEKAFLPKKATEIYLIMFRDFIIHLRFFAGKINKGGESGHLNRISKTHFI